MLQRLGTFHHRGFSSIRKHFTTSPSSIRFTSLKPNKGFIRSYSSIEENHSLSHDEVTRRVIEVVKSFNKIDPASVTQHSHFSKDLGLDSLDNVELVLNIEDEFAIVIPDAESDKIVSVEDAINYIVTHPHAK